MSKLCIIHLDNRILLFSTKMKLATKPGKDMKEAWMSITEWKKPIRSGYLLYDSTYMMFWERENYGGSKKIIGFQGLRVEEGWIDRAHRVFKTVTKYTVCWWNNKYMSLFICLYSQNIQLWVNHNVKCGFGWLWRVNVHFSTVTNAPLWWGMLIMGRLCMCKSRSYMGIFGPSSQFCCEYETALKK